MAYAFKDDKSKVNISIKNLRTSGSFSATISQAGNHVFARLSLKPLFSSGKSLAYTDNQIMKKVIGVSQVFCTATNDASGNKLTFPIVGMYFESKSDSSGKYYPYLVIEFDKNASGIIPISTNWRCWADVRYITYNEDLV